VDANTRAGRSLFDWTIHRVGFLAGGVTIPRIDITQKSISERLIEERISGELSDIVRQFSPFVPYSKDGDLKENLSEHYLLGIEDFVRASAGREAPHMLVTHIGESAPTGYPHGKAMPIIDYFLSNSEDRQKGPWRTVRNFYLHLIDEAVRNPLHIPRDPPSRAVGQFVVDFLTKRQSRPPMER
jgi:hypothetical protein